MTDPDGAPPGAVVVGGGVAGALAASVLAPRCRSVTVLERDELPPSPSVRQGVPHGDQLHNLLGRAQASFDELFPATGTDPGLLAALEARGARRATVAADTHVFEYEYVLPRRDLGLSIVSVVQPVLEDELRRRALAAPNVEVLAGATVTGLRTADGRVTGCDVEQADGTVRAVPADVVVDASGFSTHVARWLEVCGHDPLPLTEAAPEQWYSTWTVRRPPAEPGAPSFFLVFPTATESRGALMSPLGEDRWRLSLNGSARDAVPTTFDEALRSVRSLADPEIGRRLEGAEVLDGPETFRRPRAYWRRYDRWDPPLLGLVGLGDAVATLNPLLGQGVSVAAWQAVQLASALGRFPTDIDAALADYRAATATSAGTAWDLPVRMDEVVQAVGRASGAGAPGEVLVSRIEADPGFHRDYVLGWHMLRDPAGLLADYGPGPVDGGGAQDD